MIKALLAPYMPWIYGAAALAAVAGAYVVYDAIYDRGYQARDVIAKSDEEKMRKANEAAVAAATKGLRADIDALIAEKRKLEDDRLLLDQAADEDVDAGTGGLKRSSVQRLNAIR